ncbi:molybdenum cofactor biosynthesis protein [Cohnella thailandensis]|uniref:Molybdopterin synthase catalytic subunit n=1 Tax=Cohnella thailandensis TaxID=557557 RepID=A0A841STB9_9BACL|nr:molybdenum cofactor biosynthesis protein MoaE [Cohnella thailandensis]MBB6633836.1 molybdenum cofactor biosynthesis protein MoaE [Cohnella thailandensis]MBP1972519.1 molybdopterin synthase catalytic subunit [Cohnella thailandensis]
MQMWKITLFAGLAERLQTRSLSLEYAEETLTAAELKDRLKRLYPEHAELIAVSFMACNQTFAGDEAELRATDELALLPPVSGGSGAEEVPSPGGTEGERYSITEEVLRADAVQRLVAHPDHGALLLFIGTTREWTAGSRTMTLEYEAYVPMALQSMKAIGDEIAERWPGSLVSIHHRIGRVDIGEASVIIGVSSAHRADAYSASRYAIDRLKQTVPIWKKEVYEDGTEWKGHQLGPWNPLAPLE